MSQPAKPFKQKTFISSSGTEYVFQFPGIRKAVQIQDKISDKHGQVNGEALVDELLRHVIVQPKMTMEDFEDLGELTEVADAASDFLFARKSRERDVPPEPSGDTVAGI
ncbi:hypothetical protein SAMN02799624_04540 [Paenibacillus sp. UNC496MF]|uniref:hypothetical protein n=1 Tax=Paenibacillus sp. UNC496MF TaxID=1502753 RepID=UPI0008F013D2|nr:hypothetical protein [Paenibacillus sp. UNC496MF]SFJ44270.1 hypothetical protein SAMN02799624_04540 [Paenibacillus sp. UNC496MF]